VTEIDLESIMQIEIYIEEVKIKSYIDEQIYLNFSLLDDEPIN